MIAVVPMNPEYLPELGLLLAGAFAAASAVHFLVARRAVQALRAGAAAIACAALVLVLAKTLHKPAGPPLLVPATGNSMSLVLGDVVLRVAPSDRYVLSVDNKQFLELDIHPSGLAVSCVAGTGDSAATGIERNAFPYRWADIRPSTPDAHTLLVRQEGKQIFRARYSEPRRIEIVGQFFERRPAGPALISFQQGIRWGAARIAPGTVIDLADQGEGAIDFGPLGAVRIHPWTVDGNHHSRG